MVGVEEDECVTKFVVKIVNVFTEHNDDGSSTTITSRDDERQQQQQQQRTFLPPKEVLQSIYVPKSLAEIRAYVRWEEFGKPEETTAEWQVSEYKKNAVLDLKLDLLSGMTLNDIRRRYGVEPVDGDDDELPMFTMDEELEKRMKLAEAMTRVEKVGKMSPRGGGSPQSGLWHGDGGRRRRLWWMSSSSRYLLLLYQHHHHQLLTTLFLRKR